MLAALLGAAALLVLAMPTTSRAQEPAAPALSVVHVGDSFVDAGLRQWLGPKFRAENTRYVPVSRTSAYLGTWLTASQPLAQLHWRHHPSLFLITLGANEVNAAPETRASLVRRIVRAVQPVPCVWIAFPLWKGAPAGMNEMIKREVSPCRYFDPSGIADKIQRQADGIHPTVEGGAVWAEAFWSWLQAEREKDPRRPWALKPAAP